MIYIHCQFSPPVSPFQTWPRSLCARIQQIVGPVFLLRHWLLTLRTLLFCPLSLKKKRGSMLSLFMTCVTYLPYICVTPGSQSAYATRYLPTVQPLCKTSHFKAFLTLCCNLSAQQTVTNVSTVIRDMSCYSHSWGTSTAKEKSHHEQDTLRYRLCVIDTNIQRLNSYTMEVVRDMNCQKKK